MDDIKHGIINELEEKLATTLGKWLMGKASNFEDEKDKRMLLDLMQGAEEVLNKWL